MWGFEQKKKNFFAMARLYSNFSRPEWNPNEFLIVRNNEWTKLSLTVTGWRLEEDYFHSQWLFSSVFFMFCSEDVEMMKTTEQRSGRKFSFPGRALCDWIFSKFLSLVWNLLLKVLLQQDSLDTIQLFLHRFLNHGPLQRLLFCGVTVFSKVKLNFQFSCPNSHQNLYQFNDN